jgi:hypothetical protein
MIYPASVPTAREPGREVRDDAHKGGRLGSPRREDSRLVDKAALNELQAMFPDRPCRDALEVLNQLTVTEPLATVLAQRTVDEDFA